MIEKEIIRKIEDFRELGVLPFIPRTGVVHEVNNMISTIVGGRRAGKSFRTYQIITEKMQNKEIDSIENVVYLDFDNPIFERIKFNELKLIQQSYLKISPNVSQSTPTLFIFDELHKIEGWEQYVIELSRNPNWKVYVTGSSSKLLKDDISTELRGKSISSEIYPLTFQEFLKFKKIDQIKYSTKGIADILRAFDEYIEFGSFPAITMINNITKEILLREYFNTMLLKDIIQRHSVSTPNQCISLYKYLISCISKSFTIESCYKYIKTSGLTTSKDYIKDYIKYAEDAYFLFNIDIFSDSLKQKEINPKKTYCIDWGMANYNSPVWDGHKTRALENLVFIHLRQKYSNINYYLTKTEREEIDFVVTNKGQNPEMLIQVSMDVSDNITFNREIRPLIKSAKYFNCKNNFILTYNYESQISEQNIEVNFIPAYKFLLDYLK